MQAQEEVFSAAKMAYTLYGWLLQETAREMGWETTLKLHAGVGSRLSEMTEGSLKEKCTGGKLDANGICASLEEIYRNFGSDHEVSANGGKVTLSTRRCPVYEGLTAAGIDHATIGRICGAGIPPMNEALRKSYPELTVSLNFRESGAEPCNEEWILAS